MKRCTRCLYPTTKPDLHFDEHGVCSACRSFDRRKEIDWAARKQDICNLLDRHRKLGAQFDCIVPSSGGKDSHWQVLTLLELGARPLVVTAATCHLTPIGKRNIDNLAHYATTVEISPNKRVRANLNRLALQTVGDISWPEHVSIFTTPFRCAVDFNIPLIFYGENPQNQSGGPQGAEEARQLTQRWRSEFGGFLGLRPADLVGKNGLTERDMRDYQMPESVEGIEAHFLGQYLPWDSHENAKIAKAAGMIQVLPCSANWWHHENLDNAMTGIHDHGMYRKYGFGRMASQMSVDIRAGRIKREDALSIVEARDGAFPFEYMGVRFQEVCDRIDMDIKDVLKTMDSFTSHELFGAVDNRRPILKAA